MSIVLQGSTSGSITLQEPAVAGSTVLSLPATSGTLFVTGQSSTITSGTSVASTSGTSIDFTSIPSWVKRITVMFNAVSLNGSANFLIQIGAGSVTSSGYNSTTESIGNNVAAAGTTSTSGFVAWTNNATNTCSGHFVLTAFGSNTWICSNIIRIGTGTYMSWGAGEVTLSGVLDRVRITTTNGTDTFDAGSINILYE